MQSKCDFLILVLQMLRVTLITDIFGIDRRKTFAVSWVAQSLEWLTAKCATEQIKQLLLDGWLHWWNVVRHVNEGLCESVREAASEDWIQECFHILAQSLSDCDGDHADTLEDRRFISRHLAAVLYAECIAHV